MGALLELLTKLFTGGAGAAVGTVATLAGALVALAPAFIFLTSDKSTEVFVSVTYREAAFWGGIIALQLVVAWLTRRGNA